MEYINHITLNTGHKRKSYPQEIDKRIYFVLNRIYKDMFKSKVEIFKGYTAKATNDPSNGILITIFSPKDEPILTTGITKLKNSVIWELLHTSSALPLQTNPKFPPEVPYIADRIEIGAALNMDAMRWTGDFSRCMGWIYLAPEKIR
jgi:hypothetical protein